MNTGPRVSDYMSTDLTVLRPEMEILHAMEVLLDKQISAAPVVDASGAIIGVLSKKDCLRAALNAAYFQEWGSPVSGYMSVAVETLEANMDLVTVAEHFLASNFRWFPVLHDGRVVGLISRADVLQALIDNWR